MMILKEKNADDAENDDANDAEEEGWFWGAMMGKERKEKMMMIMQCQNAKRKKK